MVIGVLSVRLHATHLPRASLLTDSRQIRPGDGRDTPLTLFGIGLAFSR